MPLAVFLFLVCNLGVFAYRTGRLFSFTFHLIADSTTSNFGLSIYHHDLVHFITNMHYVDRYCANFLHHELGKRGGLEMLFADRRRLQLTVPKSDDRGKPLTIAALIDHLCQYEMNDGRKDLFVLDGHL